MNNGDSILNNKLHGIYYTPEYIAKYIVGNTIGKTLIRLKDALNLCKNTKDLENIFNQAKGLKILDPACGNGVFLLEILKNMSEFYQIYNKKLDNLMSNNIHKIKNPGLFALTNNIYGVDKDEKAIKEACSNLSKEIALDKKNYSEFIIDLNIKVGNSLISSFDEKDYLQFKNNMVKIYHLRQEFQKNESFLKDFPDIKKQLRKVRDPLYDVLNSRLENLFDIKNSNYQPFYWMLEFPEVFLKKNGFDVIVGNPPYVRVHKQDKLLKKYLKKNYMSPKMDFDIYICFIELGIKLLKKDGLLSFIVPDKFLVRDYAENLRYFLLNNTYIYELFDISRCNIFKASTYPIIITLKKVKDLIYSKKIVQSSHNLADIYQISGEIKANLENVKKLPEIRKKEINQEKFAKNPKARFHINIDEIYDIIEEKLEPLPKISNITTNQNIICGTPRAKDYHKWGKYVTDKQPLKGEFLKYVVCRNLSPFNIKWGIPINSFGKTFQSPYFIFKDNIMSEQKWKSFQMVPKILIRGNDKRLTAVIDEEGLVFVGIYAILQNYYDPKYLIGLLNSDLINAYFFHMNPSIKVRGGYFSINSSHILQLPLFPAKKEKILLISEIVSKIINLKKENEGNCYSLDIKNTIDKLNDEVYRLYELSDGEIVKIKNFINSNGILIK